MATTYLEKGWTTRSMHDRLRAAIDRLRLMDGYAESTGSVHELQPEQVNVFADFVKYLERSLEGDVGFGRIILPPRTGKTVIAGQFICATGLTALFLVPTQPLLEQIRKEFTQQIPGVAIGVYYTAEKSLVQNGINLMTYTGFVELWKLGALPTAITRSALIFADEGHRAMTELRLRALREAFDPLARVVALTATPNFSEDRQLAQYYPELIHEITLPEALELNLLAKFQSILVHEVDLQAEHVPMVSGDFDSASLGAVLTHTALFEFVRQLRYDQAAERSRGCLIACASREQAVALHGYLCKQRPEGASLPGLVLQDTPASRRIALLNAFDAGTVDTLVQIGILVEGWSAQRCKLLIDLMPSVSEVRSTQKMFRPLTKWNGMLAIMHVILPRGLTRKPILPDTMLLNDVSEPFRTPSLSRRVHSSKQNDGPAKQLKRFQVVDGVKIRTRLLMEMSQMTPVYALEHDDDIREIIQTSPEFDPTEPPKRDRFLVMTFAHMLFRGSGRALLRRLGLPCSTSGYHELLLRLYVSQLPLKFLHRYHEMADRVSCTDDARVMTELMYRAAVVPVSERKSTRWVDFIEGWETLFGLDQEEVPSSEDVLFLKTQRENVMRLLNTLDQRPKSVVRLRYGLNDASGNLDEELTFDEIAIVYKVKRSRVCQIEAQSLRRLRGNSNAVFRYMIPSR